MREPLEFSNTFVQRFLACQAPGRSLRLLVMDRGCSLDDFEDQSMFFDEGHNKYFGNEWERWLLVVNRSNLNRRWFHIGLPDQTRASWRIYSQWMTVAESAGLQARKLLDAANNRIAELATDGAHLWCLLLNEVVEKLDAIPGKGPIRTDSVEVIDQALKQLTGEQIESSKCKHFIYDNIIESSVALAQLLSDRSPELRLIWGLPNVLSGEEILNLPTTTVSEAEITDAANLDVSAEADFQQLILLRDDLKRELTEGGTANEDVYLELAQLMNEPVSKIKKWSAKELDRYLSAAVKYKRRIKSQASDPKNTIQEMLVDETTEGTNANGINELALAKVVEGGLARVLHAASTTKAVERVSAIMMDMVAGNHDYYAWGVRDWTTELKTAAKTVCATPAWKHIRDWREANKQRKLHP